MLKPTQTQTPTQTPRDLLSGSEIWDLGSATSDMKVMVWHISKVADSYLTTQIKSDGVQAMPNVCFRVKLITKTK